MNAPDIPLHLHSLLFSDPRQEMAPPTVGGSFHHSQCKQDNPHRHAQRSNSPMIPDSANHWLWPWPQPQMWRGQRTVSECAATESKFKITRVVSVWCLRHHVAVLRFTTSLQPWFWTRVCPTTCVHWVWHHSTWPVDAAGNSLVPNLDMLIQKHCQLTGEQGLGGLSSVTSRHITINSPYVWVASWWADF